MLKRFVFILLLAITIPSLHAQVISARVGINGLTCSQCSRSVEMQLRKLSFVKNVNMNLKQTEGGLEFKEGMKIDFLKIAEAVKNAGFSVRFLTAQMDMTKVKRNEKGFKIGDDSFFLYPNANTDGSSKIMVRFLGKAYSTDKGKDSLNKHFITSANNYNVEIVSGSKTT